MLITNPNTHDALIESGVDAFKEKVNQDLKLLDNYFLINAEKLTLLDYLIEKHSCESNMLPFIQFILTKQVSLRDNNPLHRALRLKKFDIARALLDANDGVNLEDEIGKIEKAKGFSNKAKQVVKSVYTGTMRAVESALNLTVDFNARDAYGKTLLEYGIHCGDQRLFDRIVKHHPDINATCYRQDKNNQTVFLHPIHFTILENNRHAFIQLLTKENRSYPCMNEQCTPLLLIAQQGNIDLLEIILTHPSAVGLNLNEADVTHQTAIDFLLAQMNVNSQKDNAIKGIARLIAHGARVSDKQAQALHPYRQQLLREAKAYLSGHHELARNFMTRAHTPTDNLHHLFHTVDSWWQAILCLFGWQDHTAFELEALITLCQVPNLTPTNTIFSEDEQKFARFCDLYNKEVKKNVFFNPLDIMRRRLASGEISTWSEVLNFANDNMDSRTASVVKFIQAVPAPTIVHADETVRLSNK